MTRWDKKRDTAQQIVIHVQKKISQLSVEQKSPRGFVRTYTKQLQFLRDDEYVELKQQYRDLKDRIDIIERELNIQQLTKIEKQVKKLLSKIPIIENVYIDPAQPSFLLITVKNSKTVYGAITQIQPELAKLNNKFSNMFFEPWILHSDTVREDHLQQLKLIL